MSIYLGSNLMCGITGYLNLNGAALSPDQRHLRSMCGSIHHRGPDEQGMTVIGPAALGMTRLSIIDLSTGQQPISNEDATIWIVFNGEIYNFQELKERLIRKGHTFKTKTDTETIVHLYEEYGFDCVQHLEGMFAFALWDSNKRRLFIARDRLGEKPLHWSIFDGQFIFGSEIKTILAHPNTKRNINPQALQEYLALESVPAPSTLFDGIHKLPPASFMCIEDGKVNITRYWSPQLSNNTMSEEEASLHLIELLDRSVKLRLISDVPLGVFLSGGIDSSTITALAARHVPKKLNTFSIGFPDKSFDESNYAKLVARHIGTEHHEAEFNPAEAITTMDELYNVIDEPIADASILPTYFLSKMTRRAVTVALSGEGGDELFGGYPTYIAHQLAAGWNGIPAVLRNGLFKPIINSLPVSLNNLSIDYKLKRFIASAEEEPVTRHLKWMGSLLIANHSAIISPALLDSISAYETDKDLIEQVTETRYLMQGLENCRNVVDTAMRIDVSCFLADQLLVKADRASMASSLECRMPFLSYPVAEFALSLPAKYKVRRLTSKYLLKKAAAPYLPETIIKRPKKGFGIPVAKWLKGEFKPLVDELLDERYIHRQGIFQWSYIAQLLSEHYSSKADRRKELWTLLMFQRWWHKFMHSTPNQAGTSEQSNMVFSQPTIAHTLR